MDEKEILQYRKYGYDLIINRFEPLLRDVIISYILIPNYGINNWINEIPKGVFEYLKGAKEIDFDSINTEEIELFFDELFLLHLKDIAIYSNHYKHLECLTCDLSKDKFIELMNELNEIRRKVGHAKSTFSKYDFLRAIEIIKQIGQGKVANDLLKYIDDESYKDAGELPAYIPTLPECPNNLPIEDYDLDGRFIGRKKEIETVKKLLYSDQDRIITITGAGGVGKTAVALKTAYNILSDDRSPFEAIIWFSAKESKLTAEHGIIHIEPGIKNSEQLVQDILKIIDSKTLESYQKGKVQYEKYEEYLYNIFSSQKCLLIIDNLETIIKDDKIINFIKNIPRPSQVLITSRKGLSEIERRYPLPDFNEKDAVLLFTLTAKEKNRQDLLKLDQSDILNLVKKVRCYPLLIKWSIGKVCLGRDINEAFSEIYSGGSEIAEFVFKDIFGLLTENSKICLYSMIIFGDKPISKELLMHLSNLNDDDFNDAIKELIVTSFIFQQAESSSIGITTTYSMLSLTRGFVQDKLDADKILLNRLQTRYHELSKQIDELEKSQSDYYQTLFSLGIKTDEEKIAFNYVKTAKNFTNSENYDKAEEYYNKAINIAPNLSYAFIEYAKFEFYRRHIPKANDLFNQAIKVDPDNYHAFFSFGICLKKQDNIKEAISMLEKAKLLNPNHLPIYNELGRAYTLNGNYEKANEEFEKALKEEKYPNYRHIQITQNYHADNYVRWAESFFYRRDFNQGIEKLKNALYIIESTLLNDENDYLLHTKKKEICLKIAIYLCELGKFENSINYFNDCFQFERLRNGKLIRTYFIKSEAYYYYARYGMKLDKLAPEEVNEAIKIGIATGNEKQKNRFFGLKRWADRKYSNK